MTSERPLSWVVGRGGLLGQHVARELSRRGPVWRAEPVPWGTPEAGPALAGHAHEFLTAAGERPWQVVWAAGAGVTNSDANSLAAERSLLEGTLKVLGSAGQGPQGSVFFASSAGGVYAGVGAPPYDETSPVRPLAPYGEAKLEAEAWLASFARETGIPVLCGRIANLYGPGQNLAKAQGLISQMCRSHLTGQPLSIYVSLDTLRDYIFAPDCAYQVADSLARLRQEQARASETLAVTKILASFRAVTIAAIMGEMRRVMRRTPRIVIGSSPASAFQARDLSLRSVVWPDLNRGPHTPLPAGIHRTALDLALQMQAGWRPVQ